MACILTSDIVNYITVNWPLPNAVGIATIVANSRSAIGARGGQLHEGRPKAKEIQGE